MTEKTKQMTEASASVCLLLATVLLYNLIYSNFISNHKQIKPNV